VSPRNAEYARELGADLVIDYQEQRFESLLGGLDAVLDTVGGDTYVRSFSVLKRGGRIVSMLERPRPDLMKKFEVEAFAESAYVTTDCLTTLARLIDQRILKTHIHETFRLEHASAALLHQQKGSPRGKVVLRVA
jgi:NADPH:quinone reductase-like Zn-dependent oxidoreductase